MPVVPQERPVGSQVDAFERKEITEINQCRDGIIGAKTDHEAVQRQIPEGVQQIEYQQSDSYDQFPYRAREYDMHQHIACTLANRLVEHEERQRNNEIIVIDEERRLVAKPFA